MNESIQPLNNSDLLRIAPSIGADSPHHQVSGKYSFVQTLSVVDYLRDAGWFPVSARECATRTADRKGFQKHMIRFSKPGLMVRDHRLDLLLYNSHDRGCAFKLIGGITVFACTNGLVIMDELAEFAHKHIGFSPDGFLHSAGLLQSRLVEIGNVVEDWQTIELTPNEQGIYATAAHSLVYDDPGTAPIRSDQLLSVRRTREYGKNDLWNTYNRVQENVIKGGLSGTLNNGKRRKTRAVKSIDRDYKLNRALWMLTTRMAEEKDNRILENPLPSPVVQQP